LIARSTVVIVIVIASLLLAGCENGDAELFRPFERPPPEPEEPVSLAGDVQPIFDDHCALSGCHAADFPSEGLVLAPGFAFDPVFGIVGVSSTQVPALLRVAPGDSDASYLVNKIEGTQAEVGGVDTRMPFAMDPLTSEQIGTIRRWIDENALDN
jgi:hypothetical protein